MKKLIGALCIMVPTTAAAGEVTGGELLGCRSFIHMEEIMDTIGRDPQAGGVQLSSALKARECRLFQEGEEVIVLPSAKNSIYMRIRPTELHRSYFVLKGRVK